MKKTIEENNELEIKGANIRDFFSDIENWQPITWTTEKIKLKKSNATIDRKAFKVLDKNNKLLPHMKIIAFQVCERIFKTTNYEKANEDNN